MFKFPFLNGRHKRSSEKVMCDGPDPAVYHNLEVEQFRSVLESFGATRIQERLNVLNVFLSTERHMTIDELQEMVCKKHPELQDRFFLQETMELFCRFGFAQKISFETHEDRYEHHHLGAHHDHFICIRCGRIQEFSNPHLERLQIHIAKEKQFHPLQHKLEVYGLCSECMGQRDETIPLHMAMRGERVRIVQVVGGKTIQARLASMGLTVGVCLEVLNNSESGPFIIALKGTRMAVGRDITQKILVAHSCIHDEVDDYE